MTAFAEELVVHQAGYNVVQRETVSGRALERAILERVTMRLKAANPKDPAGLSQLHGALRQNRDVWIALAVDLAHPDNTCPNDVKASLISIAGYVERNTQAATRSVDVLQSFIEINESIIGGLSDSPTPPFHASSPVELCPVSS